MPSTTPKQARTMAAAAHNPKFAKKVGIPTKVAKEYNAADAGKGGGKPAPAKAAAPMGGAKPKDAMGGGAKAPGKGPMGGAGPRQYGGKNGRGMP